MELIQRVSRKSKRHDKTKEGAEDGEMKPEKEYIRASKLAYKRLDDV